MDPAWIRVVLVAVTGSFSTKVVALEPPGVFPDKFLVGSVLAGIVDSGCAVPLSAVKDPVLLGVCSGRREASEASVDPPVMGSPVGLTVPSGGRVVEPSVIIVAFGNVDCVDTTDVVLSNSGNCSGNAVVL